MKLRGILTGALFLLSSLLQILSGQDTLAIKSDLRIKRAADSTKAIGFYTSAQKFLAGNMSDSASAYILKSLEIAKDEDFFSIEAADYVILAALYNNRSDWEGTLRNYLRASSAFSRAGDKDNEARITGNLASMYFEAGVYQKAARYSEQEFLLYSNRKPEKKAASAENAGKSYFYLPDDTLSTRWYNTAVRYFGRLADSAGLMHCTEKLGTLYTRLAMYDQAIRKYEILMEYYKDKDPKQIAEVYNQFGFLMFKKNNPDSALLCFTKAVELSVKGGTDANFLTDAWSNIAICHQNSGNEIEMLKSFNAALRYAKESGRTGEVARIQHILAVIYFKKGDNYHAELYCLDCIESAKESGNLAILQLCYKDYSAILEKGNDFVKALGYYEKHLNLRDSLNYESQLALKESVDRLAGFESLEQRLRTELTNEEIQGLALKKLKAESASRQNEMDLLFKQQELDKSEKGFLAQSLTLEKDRFELSRRKQDISLLKQKQAYDSLSLKQKDEEARSLTTTNQFLETQKKQQELKTEKEKQIRKMAVGIGVLILLIAVMILASLISSRKKNQKLAESKKQIEDINTDLEAKNTEVLKQKDIIEQKNQSITDSIQYASRIQTAVLPPQGFLSDWGIENFILFKPKDIVSGDFYWGVRKNGKIIIAVGDCTGHGVPGAFMSMLGHAFLDEIINTKKTENASDILNHLRDEVINALRQTGTTGEARDGMDISLIILDSKSGRIDYAGANNPIYLIRDSRLLKYQPDHMPIGIHFISFTPFTNQNIEIKKGDYLYLFTDGYADQFGGPRGKKFMYKPFQDLILRNHIKPMEIQKEILDDTFVNWKGQREQVDDVLVIGIHF